VTSTLPTILFVDDELRVLRGIARTVRQHFDVRVSSSGREALALLGDDPSIEVVCSDFRMPGMDGAELLSLARVQAPDVTRMLLSGQADLESMVRVVNGGGVHRFLTKPASVPDLVGALTDAVELHRLRTAERSLLEGTLVQSVRALTGALALARPRAFGHCARVTDLVARLAAGDGRDDWKVKIAASLAGLGLLAVPPLVVEAWLAGQATSDEMDVVDRVPATSAELIEGVPRLSEVAPILVESGAPSESSPWASRAIALARDYVLLADRGYTVQDALAVLRGAWERVDARLLDRLEEVLRRQDAPSIVEVPLDDLRIGMVLVSDLTSSDDTVLLPRGAEISSALLERVRNYGRLFEIREPVRVIEG